MASRFMIAAFTATSSDRNTISSSRNDTAMTAPMNHGRRAPM
jgi:hypothetical protein